MSNPFNPSEVTIEDYFIGEENDYTNYVKQFNETIKSLQGWKEIKDVQHQQHLSSKISINKKILILAYCDDNRLRKLEEFKNTIKGNCIIIITNTQNGGPNNLPFSMVPEILNKFRNKCNNRIIISKIKTNLFELVDKINSTSEIPITSMTEVEGMMEDISQIDTDYLKQNLRTTYFESEVSNDIIGKIESIDKVTNDLIKRLLYSEKVTNTMLNKYESISSITDNLIKEIQQNNRVPNDLIGKLESVSTIVDDMITEFRGISQLTSENGDKLQDIIGYPNEMIDSLQQNSGQYDDIFDDDISTITQVFNDQYENLQGIIEMLGLLSKNAQTMKRLFRELKVELELENKVPQDVIDELVNGIPKHKVCIAFLGSRIDSIKFKNQFSDSIQKETQWELEIHDNLDIKKKSDCNLKGKELMVNADLFILGFAKEINAINHQKLILCSKAIENPKKQVIFVNTVFNSEDIFTIHEVSNNISEIRTLRNLTEKKIKDKIRPIGQMSLLIYFQEENYSIESLNFKLSLLEQTKTKITHGPSFFRDIKYFPIIINVRKDEARITMNKKYGSSGDATFRLPYFPIVIELLRKYKFSSLNGQYFSGPKILAILHKITEISKYEDIILKSEVMNSIEDRKFREIIYRSFNADSLLGFLDYNSGRNLINKEIYNEIVKKISKTSNTEIETIRDLIAFLSIIFRISIASLNRKIIFTVGSETVTFQLNPTEHQPLNFELKKDEDKISYPGSYLDQWKSNAKFYLILLTLEIVRRKDIIIQDLGYKDVFSGIPILCANAILFKLLAEKKIQAENFICKDGIYYIYGDNREQKIDSLINRYILEEGIENLGGTVDEYLNLTIGKAFALLSNV